MLLSLECGRGDSRVGRKVAAEHEIKIVEGISWLVSDVGALELGQSVGPLRG